MSVSRLLLQQGKSIGLDSYMQLVTIEELEQACNTPNGLTTMSMHDIDNAFSDVPLSDLIHGIFELLPGDTLNLLGNGIIKYMFKSIVHLIGPGDSRKGDGCIRCSSLAYSGQCR